METIRSLEDLQKYRQNLIEERAAAATSDLMHITVGLGTCGIAAGALEVLRVFQEHIPQKKLKEIIITPAGCIGLCAHEPIVEISLRGQKVAYGRVDTQAARRIVDEHILGGKVLEDLQIDTELFPTI